MRDLFTVLKWILKDGFRDFEEEKEIMAQLAVLFAPFFLLLLLSAATVLPIIILIVLLIN